MPEQYVDRGEVLSGINQTAKDTRLPYQLARSMVNLRLPDGRPERRPGFNKYNQNRITGSCLTKHTANILHYEGADASGRNGKMWRAPMSYGLIRWHDDFQPKTTRSWTVEMLVTLGDLDGAVTNPTLVKPNSLNSYGGGIGRIQRPGGSAYLYDQAVLANYFDFAWTVDPTTSVNASNPVTPGDPLTWDVQALSALSVSFDSTALYVNTSLYDSSAARYYQNLVDLRYVFAEGSYTPGDSYHIAVVYDSTTRDLKMYVNGVLSSVHTVSVLHKFAGEDDKVNDRVGVIKRDIVLLNSCAVRGSYASTCKIYSNRPGHQAPTHYYTAGSVDELIPWCHSSPNGTSIAQLRIWHEARSVTDIQAFMRKKLTEWATSEEESELEDTDPPTNLKGYWTLEDGGPVCVDKMSQHRHVTLHHGIPGLIDDKQLATKKGLLLADGQCLRLSYGFQDWMYIEDSHKVLVDTFSHAANSNFSGDKDFTVQIQVRTPAYFQQELNKANLANAQFLASTITNTGSDTRDGIAVIGTSPLSVSHAADYCLYDGSQTPQLIVDSAGGETVRWHRAYDSTLFSIEATADDDGTGTDPRRDRRRVPIVRGLVTPDGKLAYEVFFYHNNGTRKYREARLVSATTLSPSTVYTFTFEKRTVYTGTGASYAATGAQLNIYINTNQTPDATFSFPATYGANFIPHGAVVDITIGASYFSDNIDRSIRFSAATALDYGGTMVPQRFMSPYQDQPGFFTLSFFRLWSGALTRSQIADYAVRKLGDKEDSPGLIYNLEMDLLTGNKVRSKSRYASVFQLDFKGWGYPEPNVLAGSVPLFPGGWAYQDRLGYGPTPPDFVNDQTSINCRSIATYASVITGSRGLLYAIADSLYTDESGSGTTGRLSAGGIGLLSDFTPDQVWHHTSVGDRTILTSPGGFPKVYDGRRVSKLGFGDWHGGQLVASATTGGSLEANRWYGYCVVYFAEEIGLYHISPRIVVRTTGTDKQAVLGPIAAHPDARVSSFYICRTLACTNKALALASEVRPVTAGPFSNEYRNSYTDSLSDTQLADLNTGIVDTSGTSVAPNCHYSASFNDRLFLAGDVEVPDVVYWSKPGNPEKFDTLTDKLIIQDANGDRINGMVALFGVLFVFKANSMWRISEVASGVFVQEKVADVGAVSDKSIAVITLPDTGRTAVVFWSHYGPYLYDQVNLQYIGYPIEQSDSPYSWLVKEDLFVMVDPVRHEVVFVYKSKNNGAASPRHDKALVFNFRVNGWYTYYGLVGTHSLTVPVSKPVTTRLPYNFDQAFKVLIGGTNGVIYSWGDSVYDGLEAVPTISKIQAYTTSGALVPLNPIKTPAGDSVNLTHLWVTVIKKGFAEWFSIPVLSNTDTQMILDLRFMSLPFTPSADDYVSYCTVPCELEFPWDNLNTPFIDKTINTLVTWADQEWRYNYATNWMNQLRSSEWKRIGDGDTKRKIVKLSFGGCEALKLHLVSFDPLAKLHAYGYEVHGTSKGVIPQ